MVRKLDLRAEGLSRERYYAKLTADIEAENAAAARRGWLLLYTPGIPEPTQEPITDPLGLEVLQKLVGGSIEQVPYWNTMPSGSECVAFRNEDGKLNNMALNVAATREWTDALERASSSRECNDVLLGPVVVIAGSEEFMLRMRADDDDEE